jgi:hypothetical protein
MNENIPEKDNDIKFTGQNTSSFVCYRKDELVKNNNDNPNYLVQQIINIITGIAVVLISTCIVNIYNKNNEKILAASTVASTANG